MVIRIFFDKRWYGLGGIGRFAQEISDGMDCQSPKGSSHSLFSLFDPFKLSRFTLTNNYYISPGYNGPILGTNNAIITVHDLMHLRFSDYNTLKNRLYYALVVKRIVRNAPLVFTVSEFTRSEIQQWAGVSAEKIVVLNNGIDHQQFHDRVEAIHRPRPYYFYVGNNKTHKNLENLIRAFHHAGLYQHCDLILSCGANNILTQLVVELAIDTSVIFLDGIDEQELPGYYKGALATVVVSLYEGFCLPVVESMAVDTPVITSNITAMPETAGGAALLVDPYSVNDIATQMQRLYDEPQLRATLSQKGLERAQDFSWDKTRAIFNDALQQVIGG